MVKLKKENIKYLGIAFASLIIGLIIAAGLNFTSFINATGKNEAIVKPGSEVLSIQEAFVQVAERVGPSVVHISTEQIMKFRSFGSDEFDDFFRRFFGDESPFERPRERERQREYKQRGLGTGMIITEDGYILTNYHVVKDVTKITVSLPTKEKFSGKVIGVDKRHDLAVIKINSNKKLPTLVLGNSDKVRVGEWVIAIGNPFGYDNSVTVGVVSAKGRLFENIDEEGTKRMPNLIQTDAAINPGNSGGPLVNIYGEVIGINVAIISPSGANAGIGFAIPINEAKKSLDDLIKGKKIVSATPWIGIGLQELDEKLADKFKVKSGVLINKIDEKGPGKDAGLKIGDIVTKIDNEEVRNPDELAKTVAERRVGDKVRLTIMRDGKEKIIEVKLAPWGKKEPQAAEEIEEPETKETKKTWLGITVASITSDLVEKYKLSEKKGVVVTKIEEKSQAEEAGIEVGDVLIEIDKEKLSGVDDFEKLTKKANIKEGILLLIDRHGNTIYIVLSE